MKLFKDITRTAKQLSPFAAACALVAVGYIGYRAYSFAGPNGIGLIFNNHAQAQPVEIGCNQDIHDEAPGATGTLPLLSTHYQQFIQRQPTKGKNLITNYSLEAINPADKVPRGYYKITDKEYLSYQFQREAKTNVPYLRLVSTKPAPNTDLAGGWITDMVPMDRAGAYVYGFSYRTTVPVTVSLEYQMPNGDMSYEPITVLDRQDSWQYFTAHTNNIRGAAAFRFVVTSRDAGTVDTRGYTVQRIADAHLKEGMVSITFDDGWQSIADHAVPLLDKYNFRSTQYIISEASSKNVAGYMNIDTLDQLKDNGHEIGSHSLSHCDQTHLSSMDILRNARDSKTTLENAGLGPIESFAYPYGRYDETTQPLVAKAYPLMRTSDTGYNDRYFDNRNIRSMVILDSTTDSEIRSWIDYAKTNRLWLVIAYHRVDERGVYSVTSAQMERQLKIIADSKLTVVPVAEAAHSIRP